MVCNFKVNLNVNCAALHLLKLCTQYCWVRNKYLLRSLMERLRSAEKEEIQARVESFDFSGFNNKLSYNVCRHFRSFVGRDFKAIAQCALFLLGPYMTSKEKLLWITLSKVIVFMLVVLCNLSPQNYCLGVQNCLLSAFSPQQPGRIPAHLPRIC